jgi:hypothetical protein
MTNQAPLPYFLESSRRANISLCLCFYWVMNQFALLGVFWTRFCFLTKVRSTVGSIQSNGYEPKTAEPCPHTDGAFGFHYGHNTIRDYD